jgi:hypothetical protein
VDCCRFIDGKDADSGEAFGIFNDFAHDAGTLVGGLKTGASKAANVQQNVR